MNDDKKFKVKYLLDSAVLIGYGEDKFLVDGIVSDKQHFDVMDNHTEHALMNREGIFENLNFLLFTHCHGDHFSNSKTRKFLSKNSGIKVFLPSNSGISEDFIKGKGSQPYNISTGEGEMVSFCFGEITIEYLKIKHLTFDYPEHYCINIAAPHESITFTADMDFNYIQNLGEFTRREKSAVFVNHLNMLHRKWRNSLMEMKYDNIYFYHLPSEYSDGFGYRDRALRNWEKYKTVFTNGSLLTYEPK